MCMWAAGKRRGQCEEGVVSLAREVERRRRKEGGGLEGWVAGELCTVVWGAAKSGISEEVWEALVKAVCSETIVREVMYEPFLNSFPCFPRDENPCLVPCASPRCSYR